MCLKDGKTNPSKSPGKKRLAMYFTDIPRELGNLTAKQRVVCHRPHKLLRN